MGNSAGIKPYEPHKSESAYSRLVMVTSQKNIDKENLKKLLEIALEQRNTVDKIVYGSRSNKVVVIFSDPVNPRFLEASIRKKLRDCIFEPIKEPAVVEVQGVPNGKQSMNAVKIYFTNEEKSGGTLAADFYGTPNPCDGFCFIDLKDSEVVKRVCERTHTIVGKKANPVLPYYEELGRAIKLGENPIDLTLEQLEVTVKDAEMLKFIHETREKELQDFMHDHQIRLADQSLHSLTFSPDVMRSCSGRDESAVNIGSDWKEKVEQEFKQKFLDELHVEQLEIKDDRKWKHLQDKKEELCKGFTLVSVYEDKSPRTFKFVYKKSDETIFTTLKEKIESEEPPEDSATDISDGYNPLKLRAFKALGFKYDIKSKTQVKIKLRVNSGKLELTGLKKNIQEAKAKIAEKLGSLGEKSYSPTNSDYLEILKSPQLIEQGNREIKKNNLRGIWEITSDGANRTWVVCCEDSQKNTFEQIKQIIFGLLETSFIVFEEDMGHTDMDSIKNKIREIEKSLAPFAKSELQKDLKRVRIACRKDLMEGFRQQVQHLINSHYICTRQVPMNSAIANYMHDQMKTQIQQKLQEACGEIPEWSFRDSRFHITGNQIVRFKCTEVLTRMSSKVISTWRPIERKGIERYTRGAGKEMGTNITNCHLKILTKHEFQEQKIHAVALTEDGQALGIGVMNLYNQPVDGIVNVVDEDLENFSIGGDKVKREISNYIEEHGKLNVGQVFVTGPGKLPCLMILHARAPKWRGEEENEEKTLQTTIENILSMAESHSIRSIAMPIVACRQMFGYPVKTASEILLQTIINLCPTRFQSIREIYICDMYPNKIHELKALAEGMFGSELFSIPMGKNLQFGQTIEPKPDKKVKEGLRTIVERRGIRTIPLLGGREVIIAWGDLARLSKCTPPLKADIIVNPSTTFPILTGHIANGLKAAASNSGKFDLESECKKMEPDKGLQKGSYVATDTPHMSCDQILHLRVEGDWHSINENVLKSYIKSCMDYALTKGVRSIAFPTIGTGRLGYPRDAVARCFIHAIAEFSQAQSCGSLEKVIIVIYNQDIETTMAFEQEFKNLFPKRPHRLVANVEEDQITEDEHKEEEEKGNGGKKENAKWMLASGYSSPANPVPMGTFLLPNGGSLTLNHGSLEVSGAAAIVSPTSAVPKLYGAIPSAIKKAAGGTTIEDELQRNYGEGIDVGKIAITGAGNIQGTKKVYHLKLEDYDPQKGSQAFMIYNSVKCCLNQADTDAVSSIAFPTIGTGGFKWPPQRVADETFQAVESYFDSRSSSRSPLHIAIVIFSQNSPDDKVFQTTAKKKLGQGGPFPINLCPMASSDGDQAATATHSNIKFELLPGKLEESKADVIVNTTSSFPNLYGVISQSLCKAAGPSLQSECDKNYPDGIKDGEVASTSGGNLICTKVFHIKLSQWNHDNGKSVVHEAVTECLEMLKADGLHSIAFPAIGTGGFQYPAEDVASAMFWSAKQFSQKNPDYTIHVTVVLYPPAENVNQAFKNVMSKIFQDVKGALSGTKKKGVRFADDVLEEDMDDYGRVFTAKTTNIDPEVRDFVLLRLISDSKETTKQAFQTIKAKVDSDFSGHPPLESDVIGNMRQSDIQEIEIKCRELGVEVEVSKKTKQIFFEGTADNVRKANDKVLELIKALHGSLEMNNVGKLVKPYVEWCYEEKENILLPYPTKIGIDLEIAFKKSDKSYEFTDIDDLKYCVDFSKNKEFKVGQQSNFVKVVRFDRMKGDIQPLPAMWKKMDVTNLEVVTLNSTVKEYLDVEGNFRRTLGSVQIKKIHEIKRIQNRTLYQQYALKKKLIEQQNPNLRSVEMILWHGTAGNKVNKINLSGFNRSFAGQTHGKVWFGMGVYFSTCSEYGCSDTYTKRDATGHKYIYQCKVLTGNSKTVSKGYDKKFAPDDTSTGRPFDSTSSPKQDEYVIFSDTQAYPEYLIEFE